MNKCFSVLLTSAAVIFISGCASFMDKDNTATPAPLRPLPLSAKPVKVLWQTDTGTGASTAFPGLTPALQGNCIFAASQNGRVTAVDRHTGRILWQTQTNLPISAGVAVNQSHVFAGSRQGTLIALDQATGKIAWSAHAPSAILATPTATDNRVIVKSIDNHITAFSAINGKPLWSSFEKQPELILHAAGSPRIGKGSVFAGFEDGTLARYDLNNGSLAWKQTIADPKGIFPLQRMVDVASDPVIANYHVFAATWQGRIASVRIRNGAIEWAQPVSTYTTPTYDGSAVYLSDAKGYVHAFDPDHGSAMWQQESLSARRLTGPALDGDYLIVGDAEGWVHWLNKRNGRLVTRFHAGGGGVFATPLAHEHTVYLATRRGRLIACRIAV